MLLVLVCFRRSCPHLGRRNVKISAPWHWHGSFFWLTYKFGLQPFVGKGTPKRADSATAEQPCQWQRRWKCDANDLLHFVGSPLLQEKASVIRLSWQWPMGFGCGHGGPLGRRTRVRFDFKEAGREAGHGDDEMIWVCLKIGSYLDFDWENYDQQWDFGVPGCPGAPIFRL